ncbi:PREDICTED: uncharacterized protein LOC103329132 [Prunus mume]|uniref:Uncharacterized protein LOC103329132 n=1 Tax=Prunus mume TaxID=102107 RepID=A0ABM0NTY3_PRUMU|nr:PREDICTED: uncharacterized protein LOC103329132 [Prunus mume]
MLANANLICCNFSTFPSLPLKNPTFRTSLQTQNLKPRISHSKITSKVSIFSGTHNGKTSIFTFQKGPLQICQSTLNSEKPEDPVLNESASLESELGKSENGADGGSWTTSVLLFVLWGALLYYVFNLAPDQTPSQDMYFLKKLLNLKGDDGFRMNEVLVSVWYIMGLWPLVYSMLLLPTGRSSKSKVPVWPFLILSFFGGAYALLPYFVLWRPPPPPVDESELTKWPLNFLESKLTAWISLAAGLGIVIYAGLADGADWKEYYQYFKGSKFIHVMSLDFTLLSAFAPFWVYNDMTSRKWFDKGSWLLFVSLVPLIGPALYLVLRPSLSTEANSPSPTNPKLHHEEDG